MDQFLERMVEIRDESDSRIEKLMDKRYEEFNKFIRTLEEKAEKEEAEQKT